jgi:hypothetical protein
MAEHINYLYDMPDFKPSHTHIDIENSFTFEDTHIFHHVIDILDEEKEEKEENEENNEDDNEDYINYEELIDEEPDTNASELSNLKIEELKFYQSLINTYMIYYNEKYDKNETIISNVKNETNPQMELFYEAIFNYTKYGEKNNIQPEEILNIIYEKEEYNLKNIEHEELYCLDMCEKKMYSPLLIVCLSYVVENNIKTWKIYSLKNY